MVQMFCSASAFNRDLSSWDVSSIRTMVSMFMSASALDQDLSAWDVSSVTAMQNMFWAASAFNQDLSAWDVSNVTTSENPIFQYGCLFIKQHIELPHIFDVLCCICIQPRPQWMGCFQTHKQDIDVLCCFCIQPRPSVDGFFPALEPCSRCSIQF
eukprot:scaffold31093_cov80-Attheya_sp.AAC.6